ncbi:MAG: Homing endonuclease associated repeat [Solirubrobacteraceae bacterium]|nr:Homing endonuclease associated repeat [Solirubrobacteraceae bacterium]
MDKFGFEPAADHAARRMAMKGEPLSNGELLEHLRACADALGGTPRVSDYHRWRREKLRGPGSAMYASHQTYRRRFGGWHQAIAAAGLQPRAVVPTARVAEWRVEDALGYLREADAQSGPGRMRVSQYDDWRRRRLASLALRGSHTKIPYGAAISSRLGGWLPALATAGLISDRAARSYRVGHGRSFSDTELDDALARGKPTAHRPPPRTSPSARARWQVASAFMYLVVRPFAFVWGLGRLPQLAQGASTTQAGVVMSDSPCPGAHVIARLLPVLSDQTRHQLRAMLADDIATRDALAPANHSLVGIAALISAWTRSVDRRVRRRSSHPS